MPSRREFLTQGAIGAALLSLPRLSAAADALKLQPSELPPGALESAVLEALPGKAALIKRTFRPPNFETPLEYFNDVITPNRVFFVRYHLMNIPQVNERSWTLKVGGDAAGATAEFSLSSLLAGFEQVEIVAVCQCSGNRRGMFVPHVPGVEWGVGAMGNARWRGVRLRDVLNAVGVNKDAVEVAFDGADSAVHDKTPDFMKSLPIWRALDESTLIAFEMNGEPLPHWNGFPARLVVPGWTGTYWVKQLTSIDVRSQPLKSFWMNPAYRIPRGRFALVDRFTSQETDVSTPITEMVVNSLVTNIAPGQRFDAKQWLDVKGIAWDGGYGITRVEVSTDDGATWRSATLGQDLGRFSFRQWTYRFAPAQRGRYTVMVRATNRLGATQTFELIHNPAGYHHNVVQKIPVEAV
jgi:DMSO/TMAO reductase YedYZ molybdopterin-dependent catalytic subunit